MLIGVGYDAYCVSGFAPKYITKRDENSMKCPSNFVELNELNEIVETDE
jgi:hypothetical protein